MHKTKCDKCDKDATKDISIGIFCYHYCDYHYEVNATKMLWGKKVIEEESEAK